MNVLLTAAQEVGDFMTAQHWRFCLIGGLAVQQWGEARTTVDADFTLLTDWGEEAPFVDALLGSFEGRIPDARTFALKHRTLLLRASTGVDIDIALGALSFESDMVDRAVVREFAPGINLPCCIAEDLFIMKVFAGRPRDWVDAQSIASRQTDLDRNHIFDQLRALAELKEDATLLDRAREILEHSR